MHALRWWLASGAVLFIGLTGAASAEVREARGARPNIVLIVAEDLGQRIGAFGDGLARTPHVDRLAREGVRFPNTFTTSGVCAPSRAALITGMHAISIGAQHMRAGGHPEVEYLAVPPPEVKAFPEHLRAAGYYTTVNEKLDYQFSGTLSGSGPFTIWDAEGMDSSWRDRPEGAPFFAMFNLLETHESGLFPPLGSMPRSGLHLALQLLRAWQFGWPDEDDTPSLDAVTLPPYYPDTETVRRDIARHYANIAQMDRSVGEILERLAEDDLLADTIVIFTSDHGDGLPRAKRELYDSGLRVPMVVRWPERRRPANVRAGDVDARLVSFVDLAPTILGMASAPLPEGLHGRDILDSHAREFVFAARDRIDDVVDRQRAVRDQRFKYIRSWHPNVPGGHALDFRDHSDIVREMRRLHREGKLDAVQSRWFEPFGREHLFDLHADPHEVRSIANDPAHQATLHRMRSALDAWLRRVGDTSEQPEVDMARDFWPNGESPPTAAPRIRCSNDIFTIESATTGASLGYRRTDGDWQLYRGPLALPCDTDLEAKAVRYGFRESEAVRFEAAPR